MNRTRPLLLLSLPLAALSLGGLAAAGGGYVPAPVTAPAAASVPMSSSATTSAVIPALPLAGRAASGTASTTEASGMNSAGTGTVSSSTASNGTVTVGSPAAAGQLRSAADAATAELRDASSAVKGEVFLTQLSGDELLMNVQAQGLTPGRHGMHVHAVGQCSDKVVDGKPTVFGAAEGHFDPAATSNHGAPDTPADQAHAGDLPMLEAGSDGRAEAEFTTRKFTLRGENGILGRSLIVHADADDYQTDPSGNSGARVLCGVIEGLEE